MLIDILNPPENSGLQRREILRLIGVSIENESVIPGSRPRQQQQPSRFSQHYLLLTRDLTQEKID